VSKNPSTTTNKSSLVLVTCPDHSHNLLKSDWKQLILPVTPLMDDLLQIPNPNTGVKLEFGGWHG